MRIWSNDLSGSAPSALEPRGLRSIAAAWNRFWFTPADPTPLGLMRICCGLLILYVHLLYTFDLQKIVGEHAWIDLKTINEKRKDVPVLVPEDEWEARPQVVPLVTLLPADRLPILESMIDELKEGLKDVVEIDPTKLAKENLEREQQLEAFYWLYVEKNSIDPRLLPRDPEQKRYVLNYARRNGVDPRLVYSKGFAAFSLWFHVTDPTWMMILHLGILVVILLFTVGFCTRITAVLTWLAAISYIQRSPPTLFGQDVMMNIALVYLMIGPSGAALSVDRWLTRLWSRRAAAQRGNTAVDASPLPSVNANFAIRLLQIHLCFIYLAAGCSKLLGATWWSGVALWFTMANYQFAPLNNPVYQKFLHFLTEHRWVWETVMSVGVVHTFVVELGFPFLVWNRRLRWFMIVVAVLLHTGIAVLMGLTVFQLFMLVLLLSFFPAETVRRLAEPLGELLTGWIPAARRQALAPAPATGQLAVAKT
jgi:hypothetical protein